MQSNLNNAQVGKVIQQANTEVNRNVVKAFREITDLSSFKEEVKQSKLKKVIQSEESLTQQQDAKNSAGPTMMSKDQIDMLTLKNQQQFSSNSQQKQQNKLKQTAKQMTNNSQVIGSVGVTTNSLMIASLSSQDKDLTVDKDQKVPSEQNSLSTKQPNLDLDQVQIEEPGLDNNTKTANKRSRFENNQKSMSYQELDQTLKITQNTLDLNNYDTELLNAQPNYPNAPQPPANHNESIETLKYQNLQQRKQAEFFKRNASTLLQQTGDSQDKKSFVPQPIQEQQSPTFIMIKKTGENGFTTQQIQGTTNFLKEINSERVVDESSQLVKLSTPQKINIELKSRPSSSNERSKKPKINQQQKSTQNIANQGPQNEDLNITTRIVQESEKPSTTVNEHGSLQQPAVLKTVVIGSMATNLKKPLVRESVQFSVQPNSNNLVTPDHPLFINQMSKLQQYKNQIQSRKRFSEPVNKMKSSSVTTIQTQRNTIERQSENASEITIGPVGRALYREKSMHKIDPNLIKIPADVDAKKCPTSFQIKKGFKRDSLGQIQFSQERLTHIQKKHGLPFHYVNHNQDLHQRQKANSKIKNPLSITFDQSSGVKSVFQAVPLKKQQLQTSSSHVSRVTSAHQQLQGKKLPLNQTAVATKTQRQRNSQGNLNREPSQEDTLRIKKIEAHPAPAQTMTVQKLNPLDEKSEQKIIRNSLQMLLKDSKEDDVYDHMIQLRNMEEMIGQQSHSVTIGSSINERDMQQLNSRVPSQKNFNAQKINSSKSKIQAIIPAVMSQNSETIMNDSSIANIGPPVLSPYKISPSNKVIAMNHNIKSIRDPNSTIRKNDYTLRSLGSQLNQFANHDQNRKTIAVPDLSATDPQQLRLLRQGDSDYGMTQTLPQANLLDYLDKTQAKVKKQGLRQAPTQVTISINKKGKAWLDNPQLGLSKQNTAQRSYKNAKKNAHALKSQKMISAEGMSKLDREAVADLVNGYTNELINDHHLDRQEDEEYSLLKDVSKVMNLHQHHLYHNQMMRRSRPMSQQLNTRAAIKNTTSQSFFHRNLQQRLNQNSSVHHYRHPSEIAMLSNIGKSRQNSQSASFVMEEINNKKHAHQVLGGSSAQNIYGELFSRSDALKVRQALEPGASVSYHGSHSSPVNQQPSQGQDEPMIKSMQQLKKQVHGVKNQAEILQHLNKDMQFKQVFKGLPKNRDVKANQTQYSFNMSHKGNFSFALPSEIQYELRKKQGNAIKESIKVRSLRKQGVQNSKAKKSMNYQMIMHVPNKRVSTIAATRRSQNESQQVWNQSVDMRDLSRKQSMVESALSIDIATGEMQPHYSAVHNSSNGGQQLVSTECFVSGETNFNKGNGGLGVRRKSHGSQQSMKSIKSYQSGSIEIKAGLQQLKSAQKNKNRKRASSQTPDCYDPESITVQQRFISPEKTHVVSSDPSTEQIQQQMSDQKPILMPNQINQFEKLNDSSYVNTNLSNAQIEASDSRVKEPDLGDDRQDEEPAARKSIKIAATNVDSEDFQQADTLPDVRDIMQSIPNELLPRSFSIPPFQVRELGDGTLSLNSNRNWLKQFKGGQTTKVITSSKPTSHMTSKNLAQISATGMQKSQRSSSDIRVNNKSDPNSELVKVFLDQSMNQIHKNIPIQRISQRRTSNESAGAASNLSKHRERILNKQAQTYRKAKESHVSTTPVSLNQNLLKNRKNTNLSSYSHPMNLQSQQPTETEPVEL